MTINIILLAVFFFLTMYNVNKPVVALAAFLCALTAYLSILNVLPDWANPVAALIFLAVNFGYQLVSRR